MSNAEQLAWEARLRRPAAFAAFAAAALLLASIVVTQSIFEDRRGIRRGPDSLLSIDGSPGTFIGGSAMQAVAALLLIVVFFYLFRATVHRNPSMPRWFVYLVFAGPALYAIAQVLGALDRVDLAETFADRAYAFEGADADEDPDLTQCPAIRGELGEACAEELARENTNSVAVVASLVGPVLVAFLFVMLPLRARRAGLLSPFMGILGVLCGALLVLPLVPAPIIQAFWLGAAGALFLGMWPGGRGPAWESGQAEPWPTAAQRRGLVGARDSAAADEADGAAADEADVERGRNVEPEGTVEAEPAPDRPSSRKRKRKRR